ncbi:hypothetical protein F5Y19DRAFT_246161 [Xylariaceae sp. FL1651]|nr:hypothetical protein F5Y19DRAFT_246161 [Xylariaceae sp. FL1651]
MPTCVFSLIRTKVLTLLQYLNIVRLQDRYVFGTSFIASCLVVELSEIAKNSLEGILNFVPVLLPLAAVVFLLRFPCR